MKFTAAVILGLATTVWSRSVRRQSTQPLPPSQDPWYRAPADLANYNPGHVFKVRDAPGLTSLTNVDSAYQLLYRTTDSLYNADFAVATLLLPKGWNDSCRNQLLSYGIPYDSAFIDASPSYALYSGGGAFGTGEISTALGRGWAVLTADYEGPRASFTAGVTSGHAVLDSVRAVFNYAAFEIYEELTTYAFWGYSGGALAHEWAAELQAEYAPELHVGGAALGGLTPNITSVLLTINGTVYAGLAPSGILGIASQYPDASAYLQDQLKQTGDFNATRFNAARNYTLLQSIGAFANQDLGLYFKNGLDALQNPVAQIAINRDGIMGLQHKAPRFPLYVYKAIADDISVVADTDALVNKYCAQGATIDYRRNTVGNHATESGNGRAGALAFLDSIFAETYQAQGCQISTVSVSA